MKKKILIAGGDLRQLYCAAALTDRFDIAVTGFEKKYFPQDKNFSSPEDGELFDAIILPVVPINADGTLNTPCCIGKIHPSELAPLLKEGGRILAGKPDSRISEIFPCAEIYDYMEREELSLLNAIPTAEGAVQIALEELPVVMNGLKVLVTGCGRIGTALIEILKGFGSDITTAVRSSKNAAKMRILGVKSCWTDNMGTDYALVFNTVPEMIFSREVLEKFDRNTLFIDLASKPGGIDFEAAAELGIRAVWALGLPGKTAPVTAGEIIAATVAEILE